MSVTYTSFEIRYEENVDNIEKASKAFDEWAEENDIDIEFYWGDMPVIDKNCISYSGIAGQCCDDLDKKHIYDFAKKIVKKYPNETFTISGEIDVSERDGTYSDFIIHYDGQKVSLKSSDFYYKFTTEDIDNYYDDIEDRETRFRRFCDERVNETLTELSDIDEIKECYLNDEYEEFYIYEGTGKAVLYIECDQKSD